MKKSVDLSLYDQLEREIQKAYEEQLTMPEAERLAAKCLSAQMNISKDLENADLDRRMKKRGFKTIKSQARVNEIAKYDKKPTEGQLEDAVNLDKIVQTEEVGYDTAEVKKDTLERQFGILHEAHIFFRGVAKGTFNG